MPQTINVVNPLTGESWEWDCPDDLWLDMQAYARAADITIDDIVRLALAAFFEREEGR